jgi:hypothetical protein
VLGDLLGHLLNQQVLGAPDEGQADLLDGVGNFERAEVVHLGMLDGVEKEVRETVHLLEEGVAVHQRKELVVDLLLSLSRLVVDEVQSLAHLVDVGALTGGVEYLLQLTGLQHD